MGEKTTDKMTDALTDAEARAVSRRARLGIALSLVALVLALTAATYAWFTSNAKVNTSSVVVHSADSSLVVQMGDDATSTWSSEGDVALSTNCADDLVLYPVSTFDLDGFAQSIGNSNEGKATLFGQAADGESFYHGWIDLRASVSGSQASNATGTVALYLADTLVPEGANEDLLKVARVGLKLSYGGQVVKTAIFELDSTAGTHRDEHPATVPGLDGYQDGMVLGWSNGALACAQDPAQDFSAYLMDTSATATRPQSSLANLELGRVYRLDVYYYIEGTDADSADYLYGDTGTLHLSLFAVLDGTEG